MRALKWALGLTAGLIMCTAATAYATGHVPPRLMPASMVNDAWIEEHCGGVGQGRDAKCPNPGSTSVDPVPTGKAGTMVAFGDSYTSGEGAPQAVFRIECVGTLVGQQGAPFLPWFLPECSSGEEGSDQWRGTSGYYPGTDNDVNACHRSPRAYPPLVAAALGLTLDFRACSGAVSGDFWRTRDLLPGLPADDVATWNREVDGKLLAPQNSMPIPADTRLVTVGFGGNNAHFAAAVTACIVTSQSANLILSQQGKDVLIPGFREMRESAGDFWDDTSCTDFVYKLQSDLRERLALDDPTSPNSVEGVYREVRRQAPKDARVLAIGYPRVFPFRPTGSCGMGTGEAIINEDEQRSINALVSMINAHIKTAATAAGVEYVDIENAYNSIDGGEDHGLCRVEDEHRWIHRFRVQDPHADVKALAGTAHPTAAGQDVAAQAVLRCFRDATTCGNYGELNAARARVRMKELSYPHAGCPSREEWVGEGRPVATWDAATVSAELRDVTADGVDEMLVVLSCPALTSSWPDVLVVWEVVGPTPQHLLTVDDYYWRDSARTVYQDSITMFGPTLGIGDSNCCPGHWARVKYNWVEGEFRETEAIEIINRSAWPAPGQPTVDMRQDLLPDWDHIAILRGATGTRIAIDPVAVYEGEQARVACARDGVPPEPESGWCVDVYIANTDAVLQSLEVAPDAELLLYDGNLDFSNRSHPISDLAKLEQMGKLDGPAPYYSVTTRGGRVVKIEELFWVS